MLCKQTLRDITYLYNDFAGLNMYLSEWKGLCRKAWSEPDNYIQISKLNDSEINYLIKNSSWAEEISCIPRTSPY